MYLNNNKLNNNRMNKSMYSVTAGFIDGENINVVLETKRGLSKQAMMYTLELMKKYGEDMVIVKSPTYREDLWCYIHNSRDYDILFRKEHTGRDIKLALIYICNCDGISHEIKRAADAFLSNIIRFNLLYDEKNYSLKINDDKNGFIKLSRGMFTDDDYNANTYIDGMLCTL